MKTKILAVIAMTTATGLVCASAHSLTGDLGKAAINSASTHLKGFLVQVPEPSTMALAGLSGLVMLAAARRRK